MTFDDFVKDVAKKSGVTQKLAKAIIGHTFDSVTEVMESGDQILIPNFARFGTKNKKARVGTNLSTNEKVKIPAKVAINISTTKNLKSRVEKTL